MSTYGIYSRHKITTIALSLYTKKTVQRKTTITSILHHYFFRVVEISKMVLHQNRIVVLATPIH